jgi:hypothetical protein
MIMENILLFIKFQPAMLVEEYFQVCHNWKLKNQMKLERVVHHLFRDQMNMFLRHRKICNHHEM